MGIGVISMSVISLVYTYRKDLQKFAVKHFLNKNYSSAVQNNFLKCLDYID